MSQRYYFDTSIWLDFLEKRDEPNIPKGSWAVTLLNAIIQKDQRVIYSDATLIELGQAEYTSFEIESIFSSLKPILLFIESTQKQIGKAKDLALKRSLPRMDALHALIARDQKAILVTLDHHFKKLTDIIIPRKPQDVM